MTHPAATADAHLERALGVRQLSAAIFNYTVGSGIFALPAVAVANLGAAAPLAYLVCMVIMAFVLLCFAEAGSRVSITGGPYAYVEVALGPAATVLYLLIQGVALGIEGLALGHEKVTPLANAAQSFAGPIGKTILIVGASISMLGYLSANILSVPRSWFALGRDGFLPDALSAVHSRFRSPHVAIVLHGVVIGALALSGTFEQLAVFANLTAFALYLLCAVAVWVLRQRDVRSDGTPFLMPGGPLVPIATALISAGMIWATAGVRDLIGLALAVAAALVFYVIRSMRQRAV